jgi:hypothetical protein
MSRKWVFIRWVSISSLKHGENSYRVSSGPQERQPPDPKRSRFVYSPGYSHSPVQKNLAGDHFAKTAIGEPDQAPFFNPIFLFLFFYIV